MKPLILLSLLIFSYTQNIVSKCGISNKEKKNCGYFGISQKKCVEKGCCYKVSKDGSPWCFYNHIISKNNFAQHFSNNDDKPEEIPDEPTPL